MKKKQEIQSAEEIFLSVEEYDKLLEELDDPDTTAVRKIQISQTIIINHDKMIKYTEGLKTKNDQLVDENDALLHANHNLFSNLGYTLTPNKLDKNKNKTYSELISLEEIEKEARI